MVLKWQKRTFLYCFLGVNSVILIYLFEDSPNELQMHASRGGSGSSPSDETQLNEILTRMKGPLQPYDEEFIEFIRQKYIEPPSDGPLYTMRNTPEDVDLENSKYPTWKLIRSILADVYDDPTKKGFFIEAGALDGEYLTNTLYLEKDKGWSGLLVEPDEDNYKLLQRANRNAWRSNSCLATEKYPQTVLMKKLREIDDQPDWLIRAGAAIVKGNGEEDFEEHGKYHTQYSTAQCIPTESLLRAINVSHVDFFCLDIEKVEVAMLINFPFDEVTVDVWAIEHRRLDLPQISGSKSLMNYTLHDLETKGFPVSNIDERKLLIDKFEHKEFIQFMISKGYYYLDTTCAFVGDYIFIRKASDHFKKLQVPLEQENRTEICKHKLMLGYSKAIFYEIDLRDPHHYPKLQYKRLQYE